jgi:hypothetical protein
LCLRLGYVVAHQPLAGFANQFDMLRTTGCLGLVPETAAAPGAATPAAPVERYRVGAPRDPSCLIGTEVLLAGTARALDAAGDALGLGDPASMPLRLVAVTKALLLLLAFAWIDLRLRAHPEARLVHAWLAALVLVDPFNTLYLAGFYTELAALLATWLAMALPLTWLLDARAPRLSQVLPWGLILAALALSRFQHALLPLLLLLWLLLLARSQRWPLLPLLTGSALLLVPALALQVGAQAQYRSIADANRWNSFFGAALPAARDPLEFVRDLGLPDGCAELVHTTWYLQRGRDARAECPQAFALSRLRWLTQLSVEPAALMRLVGRGVSLSGQWRPGYLGELAGAQGERLPAGRLQLGASLADGVARLSFPWLLAFWAAPLLLPVALMAGRPRRSRARERAALSLATAVSGGRLAALWLWPMLVLAIALGWGASLVGDGYSELARHLHLAANATLVAILLGLLALVRAVFAGALRGRTLAALLLAVVLLIGSGAFMARQSLGFGVLEQPAGEVISDPLQVSGWALDPRGILAIEAVWADGSRQRLALSARPELAAIFGAAAPATGFAGRIEVPAAGAAQLQIEVVPISGQPTVIDRRWLR